MSISSEITRLQGAKSNIKTAIENKGVSVPSNALLDTYASYIGQISGGGGTGLEYETGTYTPSEDIARPTISFANAHTKAPVIVVMCDANGTADDTLYTNLSFTYVDNYKLFGAGIPSHYTQNAYKWALISYTYRSTSNLVINSETFNCAYDSDNQRSSTTNYPRYWVTNTDFNPYTNSNSYFWRTTRTYKWIAIWK